MKIYLTTGEHFSIPGIRFHACATLAAANEQAASMVNVMLTDTANANDLGDGSYLYHSDPKPATPDNWAEGLAWLQDFHGAEHCDVDVVELPLEGDMPRVSVVCNITGGMLQGASSNVPVDVFCLDFDLDNDQADDVILIDGSAAILGQEGAKVDPDWVASVIDAPLYRDDAECATCAAATETRAFPCDECGHDDSDDAEGQGVAGGGWFAIRYGPAGNIAGTIGAEHFDTYEAADLSARGKQAALGDGHWACVQEMNADGTPVGGVR